MTYSELQDRHATLQLRTFAAMDSQDGGLRGKARELAAELQQLEAEIKAHPDHAAYVQSLADAGLTASVRSWR